MPFDPFANEEDYLEIDGLTFENRIDAVEIYGNALITRDKAGLALAQSLRATLDQLIATLESAPLPERIQLDPPDEVDNPFQ